MTQTLKHWKICVDCKGRGKIKPRAKKKSSQQNEQSISLDHNDPLDSGLYTNMCIPCNGSGLSPSPLATKADNEKYPHVGIVGAGIGGVALALACSHRGIPYTLFEKDIDVNARSQGYGLTLQQASNAMAALGITDLHNTITSNRHLVHTTTGEVIGEWGMRRWLGSDVPPNNKRKNMHIPRQSLRKQMLQHLPEKENIHWGHSFVSCLTNDQGLIEATFDTVKGPVVHHCDILVAADGIYSKVRPYAISETTNPLRPLNCMVILGICSLEKLQAHDLLDGKTVFQSVNGHDRMYVMPYDNNHVMWQLSMPFDEQYTINKHKLDTQTLHELSMQTVTDWHSPIIDIVQNTDQSLISGYPVYDRDPFETAHLYDTEPVTLLGDAAHPMSPFKGQGANQAILDALSLAREISIRYQSGKPAQRNSTREDVLKHYEAEMSQRTRSKVEGSALAVRMLHSPAVLRSGDQPRGRGI